MKTTFDVADILYGRLITSTLMQAVTGELCKWNRPVGSTLEDVVINTLPITGDQVQKITANVNIYVPDLSLTVNGQVRQLADTSRMAQLTRLALMVLTEGHTQTYSFGLGGQHTFAEPETGSHYVNLRINFSLFP